MIQLYHQLIHYDLGRPYYKISISDKIKTIDNKIEQKKAQYNLDRQSAEISALSSGNVIKYEFLTGKNRGGSRTAATSKMEYFVTTVNG